MVLLRTVFQAKFGKADDLVAAFKSTTDMFTDEQMDALQPRILTDISGTFDTVILETTHESLAAVEEFRKYIFAQQAASTEPNPMEGLIASGRNEYYTIEM